MISHCYLCHISFIHPSVRTCYHLLAVVNSTPMIDHWYVGICLSSHFRFLKECTWVCNCWVVWYPLSNFTMNHQACFCTATELFTRLHMHSCAYLHTHLHMRDQTLSSANTSSWPTTLVIFCPKCLSGWTYLKPDALSSVHCEPYKWQ